MSFILTAAALTGLSPGITGASAVGGPPPCPPYIIIGVYKPTEALKLSGCVYKSGLRGAVTVTFFKTQGEVPLVDGQSIRYQPGKGYYAFPPVGGS